MTTNHFLRRLAATLLLAAPLVSARAQVAPAHELTAPDVAAFIDGHLPVEMERAAIDGVTVTVVKDGQVLLARCYGTADRERRVPVAPDTLFRIGSISSLFAWTAVMQLVEQHRLDLDADVQRYIDFELPRTLALLALLSRIKVEVSDNVGADERPVKFRSLGDRVWRSPGDGTRRLWFRRDAGGRWRMNARVPAFVDQQVPWTRDAALWAPLLALSLSLSLSPWVMFGLVGPRAIAWLRGVHAASWLAPAGVALAAWAAQSRHLVAGPRARGAARAGGRGPGGGRVGGASAARGDESVSPRPRAPKRPANPTAGAATRHPGGRSFGGAAGGADLW